MGVELLSGSAIPHIPLAVAIGVKRGKRRAENRKSIEEIYRLGFNIKPAEKGPDSIRNGIDVLKRFKLQVTKDSTNLIKELRSYTWATDKEGKNTGVPIDSFNHACDAMRHVALNKLRVSNSGKYVVV